MFQFFGPQRKPAIQSRGPPNNAAGVRAHGRERHTTSCLEILSPEREALAIRAVVSAGYWPGQHVYLSL